MKRPANLRACIDGVPSVAFNRGGGPSLIGRLRQMFLAHCLAAFKSASGQHHTFARVYGKWLAIAQHDDALYLAIFVLQRLHGRIKPKGYFALSQSGEQTGHQCLPACQSAITWRFKTPKQIKPVAQQNANG